MAMIGAVSFTPESALHIVSALHVIADPHKPKACLITAQPHRTVFEDLNAGGPERALDARRVQPPVVIAQDGVDAERRVEVFQDRSDALRRNEAAAHDTLDDEVAEQHHQIRVTGVGQRDDALELPDSDIR